MLGLSRKDSMHILGLPPPLHVLGGQITSVCLSDLSVATPLLASYDDTSTAPAYPRRFLEHTKPIILAPLPLDRFELAGITAVAS